MPTGFAIVAAAHACLACCLKFRDTSEVSEWLSGPFYKAVRKVNDKEFEGHVVLTESALDNQEVAIAFRPREEWPKPFRFYRLYK